MSDNLVMENKVLALKYRPKRFEDLVGQDTVSQTLSLALDSNRLSHAYLFSGLRGSGKTSTARIMAKALLCSQGPTSRPCEVCENCVSANSGRHLDIIEMDAASNRKIDDIRDLIEHTKYKPSSAKYKVFIIDEVHMLTKEAFNALLKTLEEPPDFVKFILATTDPLKLPATILSRTQHFRFKKISQKNVIHHLIHILNEEHIDYEDEALEIISRSGQGSLRDTLTLLDQAIIFAKGKVTTSAVVDMLGLIDPEVLDQMFETILNKGDINPIVEKLEEYEAGSVLDEMTIYLKNKMLYTKDPKFNTILFDRFFRVIADGKHLLAINSDPVFVLILTLSKMLEATSLKTIEEVIEEVKLTPVSQSTQSVQNVQNVQTAKVMQTSEIQVEAKLEASVAQESIQKEVVSPQMKVEVPAESPLTQPSAESINESIQEEIVSKPIIEESKVDANKELYINLTKKVYDRNYELGECFEKNFIYENFENEVLTITSFAQDEDRKLLYKHFGLIRTFAKDIFGMNIDLKFEKASKEDPRNALKEQKPNSNSNEQDTQTSQIVQDDINLDHDDSMENVESYEENEVGSMVEDIEMGAGCVADMHNNANPNLSQKELDMNDILNSKMVNKAKELFDIKKITVKTKI